MLLNWTALAEADLVRIHQFLARVNPSAAAYVVEQIVAGVGQLQQHPRIGLGLSEFEPRKVRRLIIGDYELRYELTDSTLYILRLWHTREDR